MKLALLTLRTAVIDGWSNRRSFLLQIAFMVANDVTWIIFWSLFFQRVGSVRGWSMDDVVVMFSVVVVAAGLALGVVPNCRRLGHLAADGALDETLVLPTSPLTHLLCRRVDASNLGDILFGFGLFLTLGHPTLERFGIFVAASSVGAVVLASFLIICSSLTFFVGGRGEQAELGLNAVVMFASYPIDLFGGATKVLLFSVIPAAFVSGIPSNLVRRFDATSAVLLVAVAIALAVAARTIFAAGLRRYSSGSLWQR